MSIPIESDSANSLYCEICDVFFCSFTEFHHHHLNHIRQPVVTLVKLNPILCAKLQWKSYKVNTGVARRSHQFEHVPPLKISVVNQQGLKQFQVVKKENHSSVSNSPNSDYFTDLESKIFSNDSVKKILPKAETRLAEVEGKNLLERFGANISVSRKGKLSVQVKSNTENCGETNVNGSKDNESFPTNLDLKKENLLERLSGIGGISITAKPKSSSNGSTDSKKLSGISISSKQKSLDLNSLKKLKDQEIENEKKNFDKNKILEKLSGSGLICIPPKTQMKIDKEKIEEKGNFQGKTMENNESLCSESEEIERLVGNTTVTVVKTKVENSNESSEFSKSDDCKRLQRTFSEDEKLKMVNENSSESGELKKFVRVKNSSFCKKNLLAEKQNSLEESLSEAIGENIEDITETEENSKETGIDILERLTDNLSNTVGVENSAKLEKRDNSDLKPTEEPLLSSNSVGDDCSSVSDVSQVQNVTSSEESESRFNDESKIREDGKLCTLLLNPLSSSGRESENSKYTIDTRQNDSFVESNSIHEEHNDVNDNTFTSLSSEDQSEEQAEHPTPFWSDIRDTSNSVDQPQQSSLVTPENSVPNGESINSNFLHNFLSEHQPSSNISSENSEFMSLDRLGQTQRQQSPYDLNNSDTNTPMEQLSQQVQRIPNPTPQINVISQHHMQAPQPPQLHTGVPLSPQHISPQPNSFDGLSHMQPPMPPPLYQGFNLYNQNFAPQAPQQIPRPPMLHQRPQIQARPFQSLAAPPRPRPRAPKRNVIRLSPSHEITPVKQPRRMDPPLQARPQLQNPTAKLPSGITVTPPKKSVEANKVANVLASRGITVTPAVSRQTNHVSKPQPRNTGQSPVLNIGSGISITSSSQNRSGGVFAVPGPRRNIPIVNHHIERPERCTTVDLTQDDEPPHASRNKMVMGRFPCKQCSKIFTSSLNLEAHKATHRAAAALPFKCDKCTAQYTTSAHLQHHKLTFHKTKQSPDLAIPIVDLNHPGARDQLLKCGVYNFIPLAQLQSNSNGYFGIPIIQLDTAKEKAVSNLSTLGVGNIFVLGKMKALAPQSNH